MTATIAPAMRATTGSISATLGTVDDGTPRSDDEPCTVGDVSGTKLSTMQQSTFRHAPFQEF